MRVAVALVLVVAVVAGTLNLVAPAVFGDLNGLVLIEDDAAAPDYVEGQVVLVRNDDAYDVGDIVVFPFGDETAIGRIEEGGPRSGYAIRAVDEPLPYPVRPSADAITGRVVLGLPPALSFVVAIVAAVPTWLLIVALVPLLVFWSPAQLRRRHEVARAREAFGTTAWEDAMTALRAYTASRVLDLDEDAEALPEHWPGVGPEVDEEDFGRWADSDAWWRRRGRRVVVDGIPVSPAEFLRTQREHEVDDESGDPSVVVDVSTVEVVERTISREPRYRPVHDDREVADEPPVIELVDALVDPADVVDEPEPEPDVAEPGLVVAPDDVVEDADVAVPQVVEADLDEALVADEPTVDEPAVADERSVAADTIDEVRAGPAEAAEDLPVREAPVRERPADDLAVAARSSAVDARVDVPPVHEKLLDPVSTETSGPVVASTDPPRLLSGALTVLMVLLAGVAGVYALGRLGSEGDTITTVSGLEVGVGPAVTAAALTCVGLLGLAGLVFWYGFLRTPWDRYATLYWWLIAEIPSRATLDGPHREVATIQELISVAQSERRTVLHQRRLDGTHRWLVQTPDLVLSHTLVSSSPDGEPAVAAADIGVLVGRDERSGMSIRQVVDLDDFVEAYAGHEDVDVIERVLDDGTCRLSVVIGDLVLVHDVSDADRERGVVHAAVSDDASWPTQP